MPKLDREWFLAQQALVNALENLYLQNEQEVTFTYRKVTYQITVRLDGIVVAPILAVPLPKG